MQLAQLSYAWKLDVDDVDETVDISYHFIPHEPPNRGSIDISTDKTVRKKSALDKIKNNKIHCSRSTSTTSREKVKRNDYNDYTNVKSIKTIRQRDGKTSKTYNEENAYNAYQEKRYRQRYTESIREDTGWI